MCLTFRPFQDHCKKDFFLHLSSLTWPWKEFMATINPKRLHILFTLWMIIGEIQLFILTVDSSSILYVQMLLLACCLSCLSSKLLWQYKYSALETAAGLLVSLCIGNLLNNHKLYYINQNTPIIFSEWRQKTTTQLNLGAASILYRVLQNIC